MSNCVQMFVETNSFPYVLYVDFSLHTYVSGMSVHFHISWNYSV